MALKRINKELTDLGRYVDPPRPAPRPVFVLSLKPKPFAYIKKIFILTGMLQ